MPELILASTSPRRCELLRTLGRPFRVVPPEAEESWPADAAPQEVAEGLAALKARDVARRVAEGWVLGADTLVAVEGDIIGKPADREHAVAILRRLSRFPHRVITGVCLRDAASGREMIASDVTRVTMRPMSAADIAAYVDSGEAMGKAGAYAIQETGDRFVERIEGSLSNVVGLPLELVRAMLETFERTAARSAGLP